MRPVDFSPVAKDGDEAAYFSAPQIASPAMAAAESTPDIMRSPDGLFYTEALVNGVKVRFVVDTGSSLVVLSRKDADRAKLGDTAGRDLNVRTASGVTSMRAATIDSLQIEGRSFAKIEAVIAGDIAGPSMLGQSALSRLDAVTFSGDRLQLH